MLDDFMVYLGFEDFDAEAEPLIAKNAARALSSARELALGAVGADVETYLPDSARLVELIFIYAEDLYTQRGLYPKLSSAVRLSVRNLVIQLQQELAAAKEAAGV